MKKAEVAPIFALSFLSLPVACGLFGRTDEDDIAGRGKNISASPLVGPPGCEGLVANFLTLLVFTYPLVHDISM